MECDEHGQSDVVLFEVPVFADVDEFTAPIRRRWRGSTKLDEDVWLVTAEPSVDDSDLAALLRVAERCVAELELYAIRFWLDGRSYVLAASPVEELVPAQAA